MKINLTTSHLLQIAIGSLISLALVLLSLQNFEHKQGLSIGRVFSGSILFAFCLAHFYNFRRYGANLAKVISFFPLFIAFLFTFTLTWIGYSKDWAPATSDEAHVENIKWFTLTGAIILAGIFSVIYKPK